MFIFLLCFSPKLFFRCKIRFVSLLWKSPSCSTNVLCSVSELPRNDIRLRFTYFGVLHFLCSFTNQPFVKSKKAAIALSGCWHTMHLWWYLFFALSVTLSWFPFYLSSKHVQSIIEPWPFLDLICLAYVYFTASSRGMYEGFCSK